MYKILFYKYKQIFFKCVLGRVQCSVVVGVFFLEKENCVCVMMYEYYNGISYFFKIIYFCKISIIEGKVYNLIVMNYFICKCVFLVQFIDDQFNFYRFIREKFGEYIKMVVFKVKKFRFFENFFVFKFMNRLDE